MDSLGVNVDHLRTMEDILVEPSNLISRMVVYTLVGSVLGFQCYNSALNFVPAPEKYASERRFKWRNVMTSFAHALITGSISVYCVLSRPELFVDMVNSTNLLAELLGALSAGYFIYDAYNLFTTGKFRDQWAVLLHHILVIVVFLSLIYFTVAVPTIVIALLVEVNSIFLHGRQIYIMSGFDKTTLLFKAFTATNITSFVVFRFGVIWYLSAFMYDQWFLLPLLVRWTMPTVMATMLVINVILFWRLLKSDVFSRSKDEGHEILVSNDVSQ